MLSSEEVKKRRRPRQRSRCLECGGEEFVTDPEAGEVVCRRCGLVLQEEMVDQTPEWRAFTIDERVERVRVGPPSSLTKFDKGLSTTFQPYKDRYGRPLSTKKTLNMKRLHKWNLRAKIHSSTERNLSQAMNDLARMADKLHVPKNVEENAAFIYRRALDRRLVLGRSIKSVVAASLYAACRLTRTPRNLESIVEVSNQNRKEIARFYRLLQRELNLMMPVDDPFKYIPQIASRAGLSQKTQNLATELLQEAKKTKVSDGKSPVGMAATALYLAARMKGEYMTQKRLTIAADITEVTIRNLHKELEEALSLRLRMRMKKPKTNDTPPKHIN